MYLEELGSEFYNFSVILAPPFTSTHKNSEFSRDFEQKSSIL